MIELIFVACLNSSPTICEEQALQFVEMSPMTCMMSAQPELAAWTESHPKWKIARWNCQHADLRQRKV